MAECDILDVGVITKYLNGPLTYDGREPIVCCWEAPPQTYNDFITGLTQTYNEMCLRDTVNI